MDKLQIKKAIEQFLIEDIGTGDLSTTLVFEKTQIGSGIFLAKQDGIFCGEDIISLTYEAYGEDVDVLLFKRDGDEIKKGDHIAQVEGSVYALLSCERIILNLLQKMSGIATMTNRAVKNLDDSSIRICDTRKTHPGLRAFEKYAVTCGGGYNHRFGLYDGVMLKDNHIAYAGGITKAVELVKSKLGHMVKIEVETESREQVIEAVAAGADVIMFDNRTPDEIRELQKLVPDHIITEASGGITVDTVAGFRGCGVNYVSLGSITNTAPPLDISFNSVEGNKL